MTVYTIAQLEHLAQHAGDIHVTYRDRNAHDTSHSAPLSSPDVRTRIYGAVTRAGGAITRAQIAVALGVKKTPWLTDHIERLVTDGYLMKLSGCWRNGALMFWYDVQR
jgi:hypothetical protein